MKFNSRPGSAIPRNPLELHYTIKEIAKAWKVDEETVRLAFIDEDGALELGNKDRRDGKRAYITMRVPESVLNRVYAERTTRQFHAPKSRVANSPRRKNFAKQGPTTSDKAA